MRERIAEEAAAEALAVHTKQQQLNKTAGGSGESVLGGLDLDLALDTELSEQTVRRYVRPFRQAPAAPDPAPAVPKTRQITRWRGAGGSRWRITFAAANRCWLWLILFLRR